MHVLETIVEQYGLIAIGVLMALESALLPIPSEVVVPLGGFLVSLGYFSMLSLVLVTSFANLVGSLLAYYLGHKIRPFLVFEFLEEHLELAERFFETHGVKAVFIGRMLPAVRTFISLPAGLSGKVPLPLFAVFTFIGSIPWNFALAYLGFLLGENWSLVHEYGIYITIGVVIASFIFYLKLRSGKT